MARMVKVARRRSGWGTPMKVVLEGDHRAQWVGNYWTRGLEDWEPEKDSLVGHKLEKSAS